VEQALARSRKSGAPLPYYVMTSDATHDETVAFFKTQRHFGLPETDVHFFRQGNMPAWDKQSGKLLLADKHLLSTSPDGHGGLLAALSRNKLLDDMRRRGVEYLFYHQVDNPLVSVADPEFLGFHVLHDAEVSTKVVAKLSPEEKMGVVADIDGQSQIIEYSDLPLEAAQRRDERGELMFWAGNTAIHIFNVAFFERLVAAEISLPWHRAVKKVPFVDEQGHLVRPDLENAVKLERFIFDVLLQTRRSLVVEGARDQEFHPLKNKSGEFSPEDVRQKLIARSRRWLEDAGQQLPAGLPLEVSPLYALDAAGFADRWKCEPRERAAEATWHIE
jgi:UDP-N-acetylglucosamine/UDP-N-acetylgalactosamine diphosphorylase